MSFFQAFESPVFEWVKALHVVSVIFWMAGMLMLPRFFVYHLEAAKGSREAEAWTNREQRLLRIILNPAMGAAWLFGLLMIAVRPEYLDGQYWLHAKLTLVLALSGFHGFLAGQVRKLGQNEGMRDPRTWRMLNEIPSITIILVVILVIVKPF